MNGEALGEARSKSARRDRQRRPKPPRSGQQPDWQHRASGDFGAGFRHSAVTGESSSDHGTSQSDTYHGSRANTNAESVPEVAEHVPTPEDFTTGQLYYPPKPEFAMTTQSFEERLLLVSGQLARLQTEEAQLKAFLAERSEAAALRNQLQEQLQAAQDLAVACESKDRHVESLRAQLAAQTQECHRLQGELYQAQERLGASDAALADQRAALAAAEAAAAGAREAAAGAEARLAEAQAHLLASQEQAQQAQHAASKREKELGAEISTLHKAIEEWRTVFANKEAEVHWLGATLEQQRQHCAALEGDHAALQAQLREVQGRGRMHHPWPPIGPPHVHASLPNGTHQPLHQPLANGYSAPAGGDGARGGGAGSRVEAAAARGPLPEDELVKLLMVFVPLASAATGVHFSSTQQASFEARLRAERGETWDGTYRPLYGSLTDFLQSHPEVFYRNEDGTFYQPQMHSRAQQAPPADCLLAQPASGQMEMSLPMPPPRTKSGAQVGVTPEDVPVAAPDNHNQAAAVGRALAPAHQLQQLLAGAVSDASANGDAERRRQAAAAAAQAAVQATAQAAPPPPQSQSRAPGPAKAKPQLIAVTPLARMAKAAAAPVATAPPADAKAGPESRAPTQPHSDESGTSWGMPAANGPVVNGALQQSQQQSQQQPPPAAPAQQQQQAGAASSAARGSGGIAAKVLTVARKDAVQQRQGSGRLGRAPSGELPAGVQPAAPAGAQTPAAPKPSAGGAAQNRKPAPPANSGSNGASANGRGGQGSAAPVPGQDGRGKGGSRGAGGGAGAAPQAVQQAPAGTAAAGASTGMPGQAAPGGPQRQAFSYAKAAALTPPPGLSFNGADATNRHAAAGAANGAQSAAQAAQRALRGIAPAQKAEAEANGSGAAPAAPAGVSQAAGGQAKGSGSDTENGTGAQEGEAMPQRERRAPRKRNARNKGEEGAVQAAA